MIAAAVFYLRGLRSSGRGRYLFCHISATVIQHAGPRRAPDLPDACSDSRRRLWRIGRTGPGHVGSTILQPPESGTRPLYPRYDDSDSLPLQPGAATFPQIAVVDLLPGGVEIVTELRTGQTDSRFGPLPVGIPDKSTWIPQHADVREDRLILYGDATRDAAAFVYRVRATSAGIFQIAPAFAEGMYDRKVSGLSSAARLEVVKP